MVMSIPGLLHRLRVRSNGKERGGGDREMGDVVILDIQALYPASHGVDDRNFVKAVGLLLAGVPPPSFEAPH